MRWIVYALVSMSVVPAASAVPAYKGMSYTSFGATTLSGAGSDQSLLNMSMLGTDTVALNFWWYQPNVNSTNISATGSSATVASIEHAIDYIHSLGMKVFLKPMLDVQDGTWRANINPSDPDQWFINYRNYVNTFADIAQAKRVELFSIGCEFNNMENPVNNQRWIDTITDVRTHYSGPLTYSANWNNGGIGGGYSAIEWWGELDKIGIDAYFPLSGSTNPSPAQLAASWNTTADSIDAWRTANFPDERLLFTEVGYSSYDGSNITPYDAANLHASAASDEAEQAAAYDALLTVMSQRDWWDGAFWWNWETNPTPTSSTTFTPQFKMAQDVLTAHYGGPGLPFPFSEWSNDVGGQFATAGNWSGGVPNAIFETKFNRGAAASYTVSLNTNRTVQQIRINSNTVTFDSTSATTRTLTADDQHMDDSERGIIIGVDSGDVAVVNAGPALSSLSARGITLGNAAGASGTMNLANNANRLNVTGTDASKIELIIGAAGIGTLNVSNGADIVVTGTNGNATAGRDAGSIGNVNLSGAGTTFTCNNIFRIGLNGQAYLNVSNGASVTATVLAIGTMGEANFDGTLTGGISNSGSLRPGNSPGTLMVSGTYTQLSTAELVIELASAASFDKLKIAGSASLNGTLQVVLMDDFAPVLGDSFDILDFSSRFGSFANLDLPQLPDNLTWDTSLLYDTGILSVSAVVQGDFNGDGTVNAADYTAWRNGLDSIHTLDDFALWKATFGRSNGGGSSGSSPAIVPETPSLITSAIGLFGVLLTRFRAGRTRCA